MAKEPKAAAVKEKAAPTTRTLSERIEQIHLIVEESKPEGHSPIQLLLGVAGRQGLRAWDVFLSTVDPGSKKAAGK